MLIPKIVAQETGHFQLGSLLIQWFDIRLEQNELKGTFSFPVPFSGTPSVQLTNHVSWTNNINWSTEVITSESVTVSCVGSTEYAKVVKVLAIGIKD